MHIRTILAGVSGGEASLGVLELACRLALRFNSHVEFLHVRVDPRDMALTAADGFGTPLAGDLVELAASEASETATHARALFDTVTKRHAIPLREQPDAAKRPSAHWREEVGYSPVKVSDRARLFDLMILGRSGRAVGESYSAAIEEALLTTGRPALIAPVAAPRVVGESIAIAWNDTPECAKALAAAMPFLARAREVHVLSLGATQAPELALHLGWYGIPAKVGNVYAAKGVGVGELLLSAARERAADLLVMGGYGHAPWRELLFGGATREVLAASFLPLLLSH